MSSCVCFFLLFQTSLASVTISCPKKKARMEAELGPPAPLSAVFFATLYSTCPPVAKMTRDPRWFAKLVEHGGDVCTRAPMFAQSLGAVLGLPVLRCCIQFASVVAVPLAFVTFCHLFRSSSAWLRQPHARAHQVLLGSGLLLVRWRFVHDFVVPLGKTRCNTSPPRRPSHATRAGW